MTKVLELFGQIGGRFNWLDIETIFCRMSNLSATSGKSKYVWDEWEDDGNADTLKSSNLPTRSSVGNVSLPSYSHFPPPPSSSTRSIAAKQFEEQLDALEIDEATVSSIGLDSFMPRTYSSYNNSRFDSRLPREPTGFQSDHVTSSTYSGVSKVVQEVTDKIEKMKKELQEKKERAKQIQGDILRVEAAKERRMKKLAEKWTIQLKKLDEEHSKTYEEMRGFKDRLVEDIKKLETQSSDLRVKMQKIVHDHEQQLIFARQENIKKLEKAKKQWKTDEKGFMEKVLNNRIEQLKKQAVDALTPELDALVRSNKEALEAIRVENENKLRRLTMTLEHDLERKMEIYRQSMQDDVREETDKAQEVTRKRLETARKTLEHEQEQIKVKFESDKQHITDEYERLVQQEDVLHQQSMAALQEKQANLLQELLSEQQTVIAELMQQQSKELTMFQARLKEDVRIFQESLNKLQSQQAETRFKYLQQQMVAEIARETDEIHRKLREDSEQQRKELVAKYETQLSQLRQSVSLNVDALQEQEIKAQQRLVQLRSEVDQLKGSIDAKRQSNPALVHMINQELKPRLQTLRQDLKALENEYYHQEENIRKEEENSADTKAKQLHQLQLRLQELQAQEEEQVRQLATKRSQSETDFSMDLQRIQGKIETMLARRRQVIGDLSSQLKHLREGNRRLEDEVEQHRNASFR